MDPKNRAYIRTSAFSYEFWERIHRQIEAKKAEKAKDELLKKAQ